MPAPAMVAWAINEFPLGAQPAAFMYMAGPILANILYHIGNEQQRHWARCGGTHGPPPWCSPNPTPDPMSARAHEGDQQPDGTWHLDGVKRFITNGDTDDLFENILHMVLARPEGAGPGTKGLSLFVVPKFLPDPTPVNRASATACSSPGSNTRWASRRRRPAS